MGQRLLLRPEASNRSMDCEDLGMDLSFLLVTVLGMCDTPGFAQIIWFSDSGTQATQLRPLIG